MLDLDKYLEKWFEMVIGKDTPNESNCRFLLRFYSPEVRIQHEKECTVKPSKGKSKLDNDKYVAKMLGWVIQDWEEIAGECNDANRKKLVGQYAPVVSELLETSYLEAAFRECNSIELVKNYIGLSDIPSNGEPQKAEINQD